MDSPLLYRRQGAVAVLTLNDPARRNAMTPALGDSLRDAVTSLRGDASVRAVVLTGAGLPQAQDIHRIRLRFSGTVAATAATDSASP